MLPDEAAIPDSTALSRLRMGMVAGEASGDVLAARLLHGLQQHTAAAGMSMPVLHGIGGPCMQQFGFESWWPMEKLSVMGLFEVLAHYRELKHIQTLLTHRFLRERPDVFIGVDAPDFNFGIERRLREAGIPTIHFIGPSIWAWRGGRIDKIRRAASHMLVVFPFEEAIYQKAGIPATYVGHPLAQVIPMQPDAAAARVALGLSAGQPVLTLMPGSRRAELKRHSALFVQAALKIQAVHPEMALVVPMAGVQQRQFFEACLAEAGLSDVPLIITEGNSHTAMAAADGVLVASGTASLEVALFKKPMVIAYKVMPLTYAVLRHLNYLPWIGLPNILANETLVPELIQHAATPDAMARALLLQLDQPANRALLHERFVAMHESLLRDTSALSAQAVLDVIAHARAGSGSGTTP